MLTSDLFRHVLVAPVISGTFNRLQIVSGFATANLAHRHLSELSKLNADVTIELLVGMAGYTGVSRAQHLAFCDLVHNKYYAIEFKCRYIVQSKPVHAKTYVWHNENGPSVAFCGSSNYTINGFLGSQVEAMTQTDAIVATKFFERCDSFAIDCEDPVVQNHVAFIQPKQVDKKMNEDTVTISLLERRSGETHKRSGLNWGQREGRDPNQAYIPLPARHREFFPPRGQQFTVLTDDDFTFVFVRAQDSGKALHTTQNNALLGEYLRTRLGVPLGEFITRQHLQDYGRTDITFIKVDDENFLMDFSPPVQSEQESIIHRP